MCALTFALCAAAASADTGAADRLFDAGKWAEAEAAYADALPALTGAAWVQAQHNYAYAIERQKQHARAAEAYRKIVEHDAATGKDVGAALLRAGTCAYYQRDYEQAERDFDTLLATDGASPDHRAIAHMQTGHILRKADRTDEAIERYRAASATQGANPVYVADGWLVIGSLAQDDGRYEEAIEHYTHALNAGHGQRAEKARNRIVECEAALRGSQEFFIKPYVTHVSNDSAKVFWISGLDAPAGKVSVSGGGALVETDAVAETIRGRKEQRQVAALVGLPPATEHHYTVTCGDKTFAGSFRTPPEVGVASDRPVKFAIYGDTQTGFTHHNVVAAQIEKDAPDFVLHVGDCVERGGRFDEWKVQFFDPAAAFTDTAPVWVAKGNHDHGRFYPIFLGHDDGQLFHSFRFGDALFVLLDTQTSLGGLRETQLRFMEEQIAKSDAKWKFVFSHHPIVSGVPLEKASIYRDFVPVMLKHGVDMCFNGHYHVYQRLRPIAQDGGKPMVSITTGGGGGHIGPGYETRTPLAVKKQGLYHHCLVTLDGDTLTFVAKNTDGEVFDRFTLGPDDRALRDAAVDYELADAVRYFYEDLTVGGYKDKRLGARREIGGKAGRVTIDHTVLDKTDLPDGAKLIVAGVEGGAWRVAEQALDIKADEWTFEAEAPEADAPLSVVLTLVVGDRTLEPQAFDVAWLE